MKNGMILALLLTIAWLVLSRSDSPQALIQDVSKPQAVRAALVLGPQRDGGTADEQRPPKLQFCEPVAPAQEGPTTDVGHPEEYVA